MKAEELRQSVLQAAVQGKLVPQNVHDEQASELLERIRQEKARLVKEGKIKKEKPLPSIVEDEVPYDLPDGWIWCRLGEITLFVATGPFGSMLHKSDYVKNGVPLVNPANMKNGLAVASERMMVDEETKNRLSSYILHEGDIVVARRGDLGRCAIITENEDGWICGTGSFFLHLSSFVFQQYFMLFFSSPISRGQLIGESVGTTMSNLNHSILKGVNFPLPPLSEQQRIVAKVNELMALCDEMEAAENELNELENHFAEYLPKSILQAAVQGKLVPQNVHDEPASELLERIRQEKARLVKEGKIKKEEPLPPIAEDEIPYDLLDGWAWCRIGEVCAINPRNQLPDDTEISFTPMTLISNDYFEGHKQELRQWGDVKSGFTHYAENDVVVAKITPCFQNGKSCIMRNLKNGYGAGTTELHVLRSIEVLPQYVLIYVKHPEFLLEGERNMTGTAGQQRVPTDYLKLCLLPVPPLAEQQRIVAKVDELMALCDELKSARDIAIKPMTANIVSFKPKQEENELLIAARGDASQGLSDKAQHDVHELLGD